jgi:predicted transcriptional regulator
VVEIDQLGETAERILQFVHNNPGCHLRKIREMIQISQGTVQYHTDRLEKIGRITSIRSGLYKHYFPIGVFQNNEKRDSANLRPGNCKANPYVYCGAEITYSDRYCKKCWNICSIC